MPTPETPEVFAEDIFSEMDFGDDEMGWEPGWRTGEDGRPIVLDLIRQHDRQVAAEAKAAALRMAANTLYDDDRANGRHSHPPSLAGWLRDLADRIEFGGER